MRENKKFSHKCIHPKHFRVCGIEISNVTKESSQIYQQTPWHLWKPQINLVSLCGNSFTVVGYNREFKQIATAAATTAAVTEKVWGKYISVVCQILAKRVTKMSET